MLCPDMRCKNSSTKSQTRKIQCVSDTRSSDHRHAIFETVLSVDCTAKKPIGTNFKRPDSPNKKLIQATLKTMRLMFFIIFYFTAVFIGSMRRAAVASLFHPLNLTLRNEHLKVPALRKQRQITTPLWMRRNVSALKDFHSHWEWCLAPLCTYSLARLFGYLSVSH